MKIVIFGLTVSSSWGNGHATLWRGLINALTARGNTISFFERDVPYYAAHRDLQVLPGGRLILYAGWEDIVPEAQAELADADVAMVTSYCPDGISASRLVLDSNVAIKSFYDLDTPVTLDALSSGKTVDYIGPEGLSGFDLVLSYTGGEALSQLKQQLGARRVAPLYGSVDPDVHRPTASEPLFGNDFSYLGTYAEDRQPQLNTLFVEPARRLPERRFLIGGSLYPDTFPWTDNIYFMRHVAPSDHPAFYGSSRLTLNVTRKAMADMGYCPSGRLFEAAACGTPIVSDYWEGLEQFFRPGAEILIAGTTEQAMEYIGAGDDYLKRVARDARDRVLANHTAAQRAIEFEQILQDSLSESVLNP